MKTLNNERGVALVTALMLTMVMMAICMTLLYMVIQSTKLSGSQRRYSTALAAGNASPELIKDIIPRLMPYSSVRSAPPIIGYPDLTFPTSTDSDCFTQKLKRSPDQWTSCTDPNKSVDARIKPDFTFKLNGLTTGQGYKVYTKIVSTVVGNSEGSGALLDIPCGVANNCSNVSPMHLPSMYTIEVVSEKETNPQERAALSVLYAY
jgi:hypothetical protein